MVSYPFLNSSWNHILSSMEMVCGCFGWVHRMTRLKISFHVWFSVIYLVFPVPLEHSLSLCRSLTSTIRQRSRHCCHFKWKNKYKFIRFSMAVYIFLFRFAYLHSQVILGWEKRRMRLLMRLRVLISPFSFRCFRFALEPRNSWRSHIFFHF